MATWNSRGLRGSVLEEFINRTNEKYLDSGLALIQRFRHRLRRLRLTGNTGILRSLILNRRVPSIISELFREFRSALMQRNRLRILFPYRISMSIRLSL